MSAGRRALAAGRPVLVDSTMVAAGIRRERLPAGNAIVCRVHEPATATLAAARSTTRAAAAVDLWRDDLGGAIVAIGNAPTALFRLLEVLEDGAPRARPGARLRGRLRRRGRGEGGVDRPSA